MNKKANEKKTSEYISEFLNFLRVIHSTYEYSENAMNDADAATQDLLHQIELGSYADRRKFATKLAQVRKTRRAYKDYIEITKPLYDLINRHDFIKIQRELEQILGQVRKQEKWILGQGRSYRPRIIKDLTIKLTEQTADKE